MGLYPAADGGPAQQPRGGEGGHPAPEGGCRGVSDLGVPWGMAAECPLICAAPYYGVAMPQCFLWVDALRWARPWT